jgi:fatty acid desaturase
MEKNSGSSGLGLPTVLTLIFIVLKLVGVINWSWWWVLSPILIDLGLALILLIGWIIFEVVHNKSKSTRRRNKIKENDNE